MTERSDCHCRQSGGTGTEPRETDPSLGSTVCDANISVSMLILCIELSVQMHNSTFEGADYSTAKRSMTYIDLLTYWSKSKLFSSLAMKLNMVQ